MSQMYSIHTRYMNVGIGMVFILCESRSSNMFRAIWERIKELVPMLQSNLKFIMSDYEMAAIKVINEEFPTAEAHGCWFHFNQALLRQWQRLGLMDAPRSVLSMTMTMALLPSNCFEMALSIIQLEVNETSPKYPAVNDFLAYVRKIWLPLAPKVSIYDCPARTNNITESFHSIAGKKFGKAHNNVWIFLDNLQKLIIDEELKLKRLQTSEVNRRRASIKNRRRDAKILEAQNNFVIGKLSLKHFLCMFTDKCENFLKAKLLYEESSHHVDNSMFYEEDLSEKAQSMTFAIKSNTLHCVQNVIQETEDTTRPLQELLNCEEKNNSRIKRQRKLLSTDKENFYGQDKNAHNSTKLPNLSVVLQYID